MTTNGTATRMLKVIKVFILVILTISLESQSTPWQLVVGEHGQPQEVIIEEAVSIGRYFEWMDNLIQEINKYGGQKINEHILVHANYWIVDSLAGTDCYRQMDRGIFTYDQRNIVILDNQDILEIPDSGQILALQAKFDSTLIDINIPEYKLNVVENNLVRYCIPVRVGQNALRYLESIKRIEDLRTKTGRGRIIRIEKNPIFFNPALAKRYDLTTRDDDRRTRTPQIPWLEPEINGQRYGQLIHPTTNPKTLRKASSNGCIGVTEGDAWRVYYHAPIGTRVIIRYDLEIENEKGEKIFLPDIYNLKIKDAK